MLHDLLQRSVSGVGAVDGLLVGQSVCPKDHELHQEDGWTVTWNINGSYPYSANELAALERIEALYPGKFIVNRL